MTSTILTDRWMDALLDAANELATTSLGAEEAVVLEGADAADAAPDVSALRSEDANRVAGSYVPLVGTACSVELGVLGWSGSCSALARALLYLEDEEELSAEDMADAINEVANIIGGGLKQRMNDADPSFKLGLPLFVHGYVQASSHLHTRSVAVALGPATVRLVLLATAM